MTKGDLFGPTTTAFTFTAHLRIVRARACSIRYKLTCDDDWIETAIRIEPADVASRGLSAIEAAMRAFKRYMHDHDIARTCAVELYEVP